MPGRGAPRRRHSIQATYASSISNSTSRVSSSGLAAITDSEYGDTISDLPSQKHSRKGRDRKSSVSSARSGASSDTEAPARPPILRCYYQVLGVPKDATREEIEKNWRKGLEYYQGKVLTPAMEKRLLDLNTAWEVLGDPARRAKYNQHKASEFQRLEKRMERALSAVASISVVSEKVAQKLEAAADACEKHPEDVDYEEANALIDEAVAAAAAVAALNVDRLPALLAAVHRLFNCLSPVKVPPSIVCPLSFNILAHPVKAADGFTYNRQEITRWLKRRHTSPITGKRMAVKLTADDDVIDQVEEWKRRHHKDRKSSTYLLSITRVLEPAAHDKVGHAPHSADAELRAVLHYRSPRKRHPRMHDREHKSVKSKEVHSSEHAKSELERYQLRESAHATHVSLLTFEHSMMSLHCAAQREASPDGLLAQHLGVFRTVSTAMATPKDSPPISDDFIEAELTSARAVLSGLGKRLSKGVAPQEAQSMYIRSLHGRDSPSKIRAASRGTPTPSPHHHNHHHPPGDQSSVGSAASSAALPPARRRRSSLAAYGM